MDKALHEAILAAGSRRELARLLNTSHQAIGYWRRVPAKRVLEVERVTGIPRQTLRPDLYPGQEPDLVIRAPGQEPVLVEIKAAPGSGGRTQVLRYAAERAAARAIYSLLAKEPDLLGKRDAASLGKRLGNLLYEELRRIQINTLGPGHQSIAFGPEPRLAQSEQRKVASASVARTAKR